MAFIITPEDREAERRLLEEERKRVPELFVQKPTVDDDEALRWIGITGLPPNRPHAYLKLLAQDFIVEEIARDGSVRTVDFETLKKPEAREGQTYYVDMVKAGISTLEAKSQLARELGIDEKNIGYAGIKDRLAITSQMVSVRGLPESERFLNVNADRFFLKNVERGKGVLVNGDLVGNRFSITLRTETPITPELEHEMHEKLADMRSDGFWNFFYFQRFGVAGTPRLINFMLGRLLIRREYEEVIKVFCTHTGTWETAYINAIREAVGRAWGDWEAVAQLLDFLPVHFFHERILVHHLIKYPTDFLGALRLMPDQIRLWVYAYACHLFNRKLSSLIASGSVPLTLPFITSHDPKDWKPYEALLQEDEVTLPTQAFRELHPIVYIQSRTCPTLQTITIHNVAWKDRFAFFSFSLPKGSYATTFLMNFYTLIAGFPIPPGLPMEPIDIREQLGEGTLQPIFERFKKVFDERRTDLEPSLPEE
jgi:TruD family tRNA pseudouridine synthase